MKKTFLIVVMLLIHSLLFSQEAKRFNIDNLKNRNAILFSFDGFNLGSINGGIGWKKWTTKNIKMYSTFKVNYVKDTKEKTSAVKGVENRLLSFGATFGLMKHLALKNRLAPYFGGMLGADYEKTGNKLIPNDKLFSYFYRANYKNETKRTSTIISLYMILGIECFVTGNISIEGQYKFGGNYGFGKEKTISNIVDTEQNVSSINLGIWSSSIILSIYL
ncbi:MAG TPA: hypothetical protein ENH29_00625 [Bacteroidetes bacterium]|nr:hypothetical protein [Bacteroidota bacterium]